MLICCSAQLKASSRFFVFCLKASQCLLCACGAQRLFPRSDRFTPAVSGHLKFENVFSGWGDAGCGEYSLAEKVHLGLWTALLSVGTPDF